MGVHQLLKKFSRNTLQVALILIILEFVVKKKIVDMRTHILTYITIISEISSFFSLIYVVSQYEYVISYQVFENKF